MNASCSVPGDCTCRGYEGPTDRTAIENDVFAHVRDAFALPENLSGAKFHFVILDSQHGCASSLGLEPESGGAQDVRDIADHITKFVAGLTETTLLNSAMIDLLRDCLGDGFTLTRVNSWANQYMAHHGQPLDRRPSRLEQCLAIEAALASNDLEMPPPHALAVGEAGHKHLYFIDNYFEENREWTECWRSAMVTLGGARPSFDATTPVARATLPFLLAECMQFWVRGENTEQFLARLGNQKPGIAILPFRILGQYRAAAIWCYNGPIASHTGLKDHIIKVSRSARWLTPTVESALLYKTSSVLLEAIYQHNPNSPRPFTGCRQTCMALANLFYSRDARLLKGNISAKALHPPSRGALMNIACEAVVIDISDDEDVVRFLGFDKIEYECPLIHGHAGKVAALVKKRLQLAVTAAKRAFEVARERERVLIERLMRENEVQERLSMSVTAHDFANALKDLQALSADWGANQDGLSAEDRLLMVHRRAQQLTGNAYIMRKRARRSDGADDDGLPQATRQPTWRDGEFWNAYIRAMSICTAFAERRLILSGQRQAAAMDLRYGFEFRNDDSGETLIEPPTSIAIGRGRTTLEPIPDLIAENLPIWPLDETIRRTAGKLGEYGQIALMLWGTFELLRNACSESAKLIRDRPYGGTRTVAISFAVTGQGDQWRLRSVVENDTFAITATDPKTIPSLQRIREAIPEYQFYDEPAGRGRARYICELPIKSKEALDGQA